MIKIVFFDVDGTLIDHSPAGGGKIPESTVLSLHALRAKGIKLFVATGRIPSMVSFLEDIFPFDGFVTLNGQLVLEQDGTVLHRMAHHPEDIRRLVQIVRRENFPCLIIEEHDSFCVAPSEIIREHFADWLGLPVPEIYDLSRLDTHDVLQFLAYIPPEDRRLLDPLEHIEITSAGGEIYDVIPQGGGKEVGIAAAAAYYGIAQDEVMVFGDGDNDARMMAWAGTGVALGNGMETTKRAADYVTADVGDAGIQKALLHFGLLTPADLEAAARERENAPLEYQIREMLPQEYPLLDDFLYEAIFQREGDPPLPKTETDKPALQVYIQGFGTKKDDHCLCAVVNQTIVGAVWVRNIQGYGSVDGTTPEFAISLYPAYRGRGIGAALMKRMLDLLKSKGYKKASLAVQKDNYALRMYQKAGFSIVGETAEEYIMECRI